MITFLYGRQQKHYLFMRDFFQHKSHDISFVDEFRTNQCGSSLGQVE